MLSLGLVFLVPLNAQIKVSSNNKLFLANTSEEELRESVDAVLMGFFNLAQNGQRSEWEKLLASNCYKDGIPRKFVNSWFDSLAFQKTKYTIEEISSPKTNQRIIQYSSSPGTNKNKIIVLIKEKGND